jgi:hypothetical protein
MLGSIFGAILFGHSATPVMVEAPIQTASVYKSGMVMTIREAVLQEGTKEYELVSIPLAYEGSFWPQPDENIEVSDLRSTLEMAPTKVKVQATNIAQMIAFNIGRTMTLVVPLPEGKSKRVTGKALSYTQRILTVEDTEGVIRPIPIYGDIGLVAKGLVMEKEMTRTLPRIRLTFRAAAKAGARLKFLSLERGASWSNHYLLDLRDKTARLSAKATIGLGGMKLEQVKVDLVSGQPGLNLKEYDFSLGGKSLEDYLNPNGRNYLPETNPDPYELLAQIMQREAQRLQAAMQNQTQVWGGGMGGAGGGTGGQGTVPERVDNIIYDPSVNSFIVQGTDEAIRQLETIVQVEDAYVIPMGRLTLNPGERLTRMLYDKERPFERVFKAQETLGNDSSDVGTTGYIKIINDSGAAWTAGPMLVVSNVTPQKMVTMPFTGPGGTLELNMGNSNDVKVSSSSELLKREVLHVENGRETARLTIETKMTATNRRTTTAPVELSAGGPGNLVDAGGGEAKMTPGGNEPSLWVKWAFDLQPGESKTVTCRYAVIQVSP